jgi:hypothetical protein
MPLADRLARSLDHPVDAVCPVRPRWTIRTSALCAGAGAGIGSVLGATGLWAGVGGGVGALIGYLLVWLRLRGSGLSLGMALALAADRLELHRLSMFGGRSAGLIRAVPYTEIEAVEVRPRVVELGLDVITRGEPIEVDTSKRGVAAGGPFAEELRRRISA